MNGRREYGPITDADLLAYLDGMLDDEPTEHVEREAANDRDLDARLELLRAGERPFAEAFDALMAEAPGQRLDEILERAKNLPPPLYVTEDSEEDAEPDPVLAPAMGPAPQSRSRPVRDVASRREPWRGWRMLAAAAILVAVFAAGVFSGRFVPGLGPQVASIPGEQGWRAAVAEYQALFVKATLEQADHDREEQDANLDSALSHIGLKLDVSKVSAPLLDFKYAGILNFKGKPLVQMSYLYDKRVPVSFCIIRNGKPAHGLMAEQRLGMNIAHWQSDGYGFMVIGDISASAVHDIARQFKEKLS
jgi:anti-sigma factor RsiW